MFYAEVAINAPVKQTFHYHIPAALDGRLRPGHLVRVSFGTAMQPGIVLAIHPNTPVQQTKPVEARLDPEPVVTPQQIALAYWLSESYLTPIGICLWLMLPPGITGQHDLLVTLCDDDGELPSTADDLHAQIISLLRRRGALRLKQIRQSLKDDAVEGALKALAAADIVQTEAVLSPPAVRPQLIQTAALNIHPQTIPDVRPYLGRKSRRADLLEVVAELTARKSGTTVKEAVTLARSTKATLLKLVETHGYLTLDGENVHLTLPPDDVPEALLTLRAGERDLHILRVLAREAEPIDVSWVYAQTGATLNDLKRLEALDFVRLGEKHTWRDSLANRDFVPAVAPAPTPEQAQVWQVISQAIDDTQVEGSAAFLLHGVTGSGKTEIYLRAVEAVLAQGRQAIFLVPEIALTAQMVRRVAARFPGKVAVIHGSLSQGERYDTWRRARTGQISIIVGARSALFAPLPNLGLIVLDEEHDASYKQSPPISAPYYDSRHVGEVLSRLHNAVLILGSATPDVETYYRAQRGDFTYLHLPSRIMGHRTRIQTQAAREGVQVRYAEISTDTMTIDLPPVQVVDMRAELQQGNTSIFSAALREALATILQRHEQAILFLNRRGSATYVFCRDCGYVAKCPRCDTPLTYHAYDGGLRCHHCGYEGTTPTTCPQCGSKRIKFFGAGTQQVEAELNKLYPQARVVRWDADTASRPELHDAILGRFLDHHADVMVGTQMVAKGLDLPLVTLVGVISADTGINLPDFRAGERTFQLLAQVAGRAGRGLLGGRVVLQTYQPAHYAIAAAAHHNYDRFYSQEVEYRRQLGYPPFRRLARVLIQHANTAHAQEEARRAAGLIQQRIDTLNLTGTEIIGPTPCFFGRVNKLYRWQVLVRGAEPAAALDTLDAGRGWYVDLDPVDVL